MARRPQPPLAHGTRNWRCLLPCTVLGLFASLVSTVIGPSQRAFFNGDRLLAPSELARKLPLPGDLRDFVAESRAAVSSVLEGADDRFLVVVGPCSIHDPAAALEYARWLHSVAAANSQDLLVVMRTYLEKPRTAVGWRGLVSDPDLSGGEDLAKGLALGREVLLAVNLVGLPVAVEFLDPLVAPYFEDLVTYGSIGARTVESPTHRQLAAALALPVGFKNGRGGDIQSAVNAVVAAAAPQRRLLLDERGRLAARDAAGNPMGHVVLRGSEDGPNFGNATVKEAGRLLQEAGFAGRRVVVDCSHGNSGKRHEGQIVACESVAEQVAAGGAPIGGVMIESFLKEGNQPLNPGVTQVSDLEYGVSVTDACVGLEDTQKLLETLAAAVRERRSAPSLREEVSADL